MTELRIQQYGDIYYYICTQDGSQYLWKNLTLHRAATDGAIEKYYDSNAYYKSYEYAHMTISKYHAKERGKTIVHTRL